MATWTDALAEYQRVKMIMEAIDSEQHEAAFDAAADVQSEKIEDLLCAPAPDLSAIEVKLRVMQSSGNQHLLAPILADIERLKAPATTVPLWGDRRGSSYFLPSSFPGASQELARAADQVMSVYFDQSDDAGDLMSVAAAGVAAVPARSIVDLAAKIMLGLFECEPSHRGKNLCISLSSFGTDNAAAILLGAALDAVAMIPPAEDARLVEAYETYRTAFAQLKASGVTADYDPFYAVMDPADMVLKTTAALTAAGVAMKLKRAFVGIVGKQWSDHAVFDERPADYERNVQTSDLYEEMFWRAIEDLERIAAREAQA